MSFEIGRKLKIKVSQTIFSALSHTRWGIIYCNKRKQGKKLWMEYNVGKLKNITIHNYTLHVLRLSFLRVQNTKTAVYLSYSPGLLLQLLGEI